MHDPGFWFFNKTFVAACPPKAVVAHMYSIKRMKSKRPKKEYSEMLDLFFLCFRG